MDDMLLKSQKAIWMVSTTDEAEVNAWGYGMERVGPPLIALYPEDATAPPQEIFIFAGCDRATFDRIAPFLKTMGRRILIRVSWGHHPKSRHQLSGDG